MEEIKLPDNMLGSGRERIVGVVNFRGDVIIATEFHVYRMSHDEFTQVKFELLRDNDGDKVHQE